MPKRVAPEPLHVSVTGRNMPVTDPLEKYVVTKIGRLTRYLDRLARVEVVLANEHTREANGRNVAEATATVKGRTIRAEAADADMYAAIDGVVDKLHLQLTRVKERTRAHKGRGPGDAELPEPADLLGSSPTEPDDEELASPEGGIVEVKQFALKPMFPDEAIDALEDTGHAFFVFLSAETEKVSVVYRRRDGAYGLIEPAFE
jgi:putative sigma-54 modulation protein